MNRDLRRARRRKADATILVVDAMTDEALGRLGNLSETGLLLMAATALPDDALFQLRFALPGAGGPVPVEVGAHLLWQDAAGASGQCWSGFRFITVPPDAAYALRDWVGAGTAAEIA